VLFKGFAKPEQPSEGHHDGWANINGMLRECLCDGLLGLRLNGHISTAMFYRMRGLLYRYGELSRTTQGMFFWPLSKEGAYERAKFCTMMIEQNYKEMFSAFGLQGPTDITHMWYI
jgi:hypothetical protein